MDSKSIGWGFESLLPCHFKVDMEKTYNKIIAISFVIAAALFGWVVNVAINILVNTWGSFARVANNTVVSHGVPIAAAILFFFVLIFNTGIRSWASDVALEIGKIVWPSVKDTRSLTIVVCMIILIAAVLFSVFDLVSGYIVEFILDLEI
jgi:preprotein translocase subunit SecE